jgi:lipoate-protein ligase A
VAATFRVIDTGVRDGRRQIAFDQAMIDAHKAGVIPDSIRFLRFPPTALIGRHQALAREINLDHCRANGIGVARRITGGGAIYFDEGQLGWELIFHRATLGMGSLAEAARRICEAAAAGLARLGIQAQYRPRNDIEVGGRKVSGTGGFFDQDTLFYQGTVLVDMNPADMITALNVAQSKIARQSLDSAAQRVVTLKELLGTAPAIESVKHSLLAGFAERLGITPVAGEITPHEEALAARYHDEELGTDAFVAEIDDPATGSDVLAASHTGVGGTIHAYIRLAGAGRDRIREALITGDFFVTPPRTIFDLEASLRDIAVADAGDVIERFFQDAEVGLLTAAPSDFRKAVEDAIATAR